MYLSIKVFRTSSCKNSIIESNPKYVTKKGTNQTMQFLAMFIKILKICIELTLIIIFYGQLDENNHIILMLRSTQHMPCSSVFIDLVTQILQNIFSLKIRLNQHCNLCDSTIKYISFFSEQITVFLASGLILKIPGDKSKMYLYVIKGN